MTQRTARLLAASLTAFVLVVLGVGAFRGTEQNNSATAAAPALASVDTSTSTAFQEREATYRQAIELANAQVAEANRRLQEAAGTPQQSEPVMTAADTISGEQASQRALAVAPGTSVTRIPELVDYQGTAAYEVVLDQGTSYVDARSGAVLFNGVAQNSIRADGESEHDDDERDDDRQ